MRSLAIAAANARTDEETVLEFSRAGWIKVIQKNGCRFVSGQDEYKARFIVDLRTKLKLADEQIEIVLAQEKPPYSLEQVAAILANHKR